MRKSTWYEILEVSENASPEVIEKAYKVLVKKYHPDLQTGDSKAEAEKKMKQINEAYDILSNSEKRKEYDFELNQLREQEERKKQEKFYTSNQNDNADFMDYVKDRRAYHKRLQKEEEKQREKMQEDLNKEYQNAYENYLQSLGYRIKRGWTKERIRDIFIVLLIMAGIIAILWFIPPSHDWMVNFYEENPILKTIIDVIVAIITGIFTGIWKFITGLFS